MTTASSSAALPQQISTATDRGWTSTIDTILPDILETHILTRLDGPTLASAACTCSQLCQLASQEELWTNICHSTWPSTATPRVRQVISTFPSGPRSFYSDSFPLLTSVDSSFRPQIPLHQTSELISAVDVYYKNELLFSKVVETETVSGWFRCSPFRIDLLDPKNTVSTVIPYPTAEDKCHGLAEDLTLSWIIIDPVGRRSINLSTHKPISVQRHWLSGEIHARFAAILTGERASSSSEFVQCGIVVTLGGASASASGSGGGKMVVLEVSLQVEDMDGTNLNGKDSLVILQRALEGKRGRKRVVEEWRKRYEEFIEMKKKRKEKKLRREGTLDMLCVSFGIFSFAVLGLYLVWR